MKYLSKDIILEHTTQENIFLHFLNLTTFPTGNVSSPFTKDENASFKLYKNGSFKCNSSGFQGDVWQFVANLKDLDSKTQFIEVLQIIATELNLLQLIDNNIATSTKTTSKTAKKEVLTIATACNNTAISLQENCNNIVNLENAKKLIVKIRPYTDLDLIYWDKLGVKIEILQKFKVHSISENGFDANKWVI